MKRGRWFGAIAFVIGAAAIAHALTGDLDTSFDAGSGVDNTVYAIAVQPGDGKAIIGGDFLTARNLVRNRIARVNTDGTGDPTFNPGSGANFRVSAIAIQPSDGKVLVGGSFTSFNGDVTHPYLVRLNTDGSIDSGFSNGTGVNGPVNAIAVQGDGKIVIGGSFTGINGTQRGRVARLNTDGGVDSGFADPNVGVSGFPIGNGPYVNAVTLQVADGMPCVQKVIIGGAFSTVGPTNTNRYYIARLNCDGTLDTSFTSVGQFPGFTQYAINSIALQADNKILVAGPWPTSSGARPIIRLSATDGTVDGTFGDPFAGASPAVYSVLVQPADQKVIIAGQFSNVGVTATRDIARLGTTGTVDGAFALSNPGDVWFHAAALQPADSKVVVGGELSSVFVAGRHRLADAKRRLQTLRPCRLPGRMSDRRHHPHRVRHRGHPG